jgi:peptidoglycan hydrolase CwlO-like protein
VSKHKSFWNNGKNIWAWLLIIAFIIGAISQGSLALFKSNQAYECSQKNEDLVRENDKRIEVLDTKLENIQKTIDGIDKKIDGALRR